MSKDLIQLVGGIIITFSLLYLLVQIETAKENERIKESKRKLFEAMPNRSTEEKEAIWKAIRENQNHDGDIALIYLLTR